ncbi:MAG TPA: tetratricopeptide repeat protein [Bacteroidetes bacterium]|nr:tetratricopeptide repeat protein [Bacteroidota bacterium]
MKQKRYSISVLAGILVISLLWPACVHSGGNRQKVSREDSLLSVDLCLKGLGFALNGKLEESLDAYSEAIRINPWNATAYGGRGMIRLGLSDLEGAYQDASRAIELDSTNADWYGNRAYVEMLRGNLPGALNDLNKSLQLNPSYGWAYTKRGNVKYMMKDISGACEDWKIAIGYNETEAMDSVHRHCF